MKRVIVQAFCDLDTVDDEGDEEVPATAEIPYNGKVLDLCEHHRAIVQGLIDNLERLFSAGTEAEEPPPRPPSRRRYGGGRPRNEQMQNEEWRTCQEPDCIDSRTRAQYVAPTRSALGQHAKQKHGKVLGDYDWPLPA